MTSSFIENRLIEVWEQGYGCSHLERANCLLQVAKTEVDKHQFEQFTVGERDQLLTGLYIRLFGKFAEAKTSCRECETDLETQVKLDDFLVPEYRAVSSAQVFVGKTEFQVEPIRLKDLPVIHALGGSRWISTRCLKRPGDNEPLAQNDEAKVIEALAGLDPKADICLEMKCSECESVWLDPFDIAAHFWVKLDGFCRKILATVHTLASAYGWSEEQVLSLSPWRREVYLNMARSS